MWCTTGVGGLRWPSPSSVERFFTVPWEARRGHIHPRHPLVFLTTASDRYGVGVGVVMAFQGDWEGVTPPVRLGDLSSMYVGPWHPRHPWLPAVRHGPGALLLWDTLRHTVSSLPLPERLFPVRWHPVEDLFAAEGPEGFLWVDVRRGSAYTLPHPPDRWWWTRWGLVAVRGWEVSLWTLDGRQVGGAELPHEGEGVWEWSLSPDGTCLAAVGPKEMAVHPLGPSRSRGMRMRLPWTIPDRDSRVRMVWSPSGRFLAWFHAREEHLGMWDRVTGEMAWAEPPGDWLWRWRYRPEGVPPPELLWDPRSRWLALSAQGRIAIWDAYRRSFLPRVLSSPYLLPSPQGNLVASERAVYRVTGPPLEFRRFAALPWAGRPLLWWPDERHLLVARYVYTDLVLVRLFGKAEPAVWGRRRALWLLTFQVTSWGWVALHPRGGFRVG